MDQFARSFVPRIETAVVLCAETRRKGVGGRAIEAFPHHSPHLVRPQRVVPASQRAQEVGQSFLATGDNLDVGGFKRNALDTPDGQVAAVAQLDHIGGHMGAEWQVVGARYLGRRDVVELCSSAHGVDSGA